jgi:glycosyltransferase involved in cell wall biosynthesis
MPSILFINRVYPPDSGATGRVLQQAAETFVRAGWEVTILATAGGKADAGMTIQKGVTVVRVGTLFSKSSLLARALGYALMIPSLLANALMLPRADVVVTKTDPPMLLVLGPLLRVLKGSILIHWAQDLYPEVAEEAGVFGRGGIVAGLIRSISTLSLKAHHRVVSVGRCMTDRLVRRGISPSRIVLIPNLGMEDDIRPLSRSGNPFRASHGIPEEAFVIEYSGNLGRAHEFETVLDAARLLQERGEDVLLLVVGEGPSLPGVERGVATRGLRNVKFLPSQPGSVLSESLGAGDLHLVTMREGMSGLVVPSKFYGILAAERPCLFVGPVDSEVVRVISETTCGVSFPNGDAEGVAKAISAYRNHQDRVAVEGRNGRGWLMEQRTAGERLLEVASGLVEGLVTGK